MKTAGEARTRLLEIGRRLTAYDFGDAAVVGVSRHVDGATFFWPDAFTLVWHEWIFVFTEHYGYYEFHKDDMLVRMVGGDDINQRADDWAPTPESVEYLKDGLDNGAEGRVMKATPSRPKLRRRR